MTVMRCDPHPGDGTVAVVTGGDRNWRDTRRSAEGRRSAAVGWLFVAPFLIVFTLFVAVPVIGAIGASLTDMTAADMRRPFEVDFAGLSVYTRILTDPTFGSAAVTTLVFVLITVPASMVLGLLLAVVLNRGIRRLKPVYRAAIYVPVVTNIVAAAVIWKYAFTTQGPVNEALAQIGIVGPNWLGEPEWAIVTVSVLGIWRNVGTCMVLFLAGLQAVPQEVYEAAAIDGAGSLRSFWSMTLPLLRPTTLLVSVLMSIAFLNIFEEPYVVTQGGPLGSTTSIALWIFQQFGYGNTAASMGGSVLLLLAVAVISIIQFRILRPKH
jgi:multiple sugar transport system permease protein